MPDQFTLVQTLSSPLPGSTVSGVYIGDGFGAAVSIDDGRLAVSAQDATVNGVNDAGAVIWYKLEDGQFVQSQEPFTESIPGDVFGAYNSFKIKDRWAMVSVGTPVTGVPGPSQHPGGAVLIFRHDEGRWNLVQTLLPPGPPTYVYNGNTYGIEFFGQFGDFDNEWAFIGAPQNIVNGVPLAGNVYVYHLEDGIWTLTQTITSPTGVVFNQAFGGASYIHKDYAFITAEGNYTQFDTNPPDNGYAYFYHLNHETKQWEFVQLLRGNAPMPVSPSGIGDLFGFRIGFNEHWAFIGSPLDNTNPQSIPLAGAVYLYKAFDNNGLTNWQLISKIYPLQPNVQGAFGTNVVLHGDHAYITSNNSTPDGTLKHVGSVEVFEKDNGLWSYLTTILNPNPHQADFFGSSMSATHDYFVVGDNANFAYYQPSFDVPPPSSFNNGNVYVYKH